MNAFDLIKAELEAEMKKRIVVRPVAHQWKTITAQPKRETRDGVVVKMNDGSEAFFPWSQVDGWKIWHAATKQLMFVPV